MSLRFSASGSRNVVTDCLVLVALYLLCGNIWDAPVIHISTHERAIVVRMLLAKLPAGGHILAVVVSPLCCGAKARPLLFAIDRMSCQ